MSLPRGLQREDAPGSSRHYAPIQDLQARAMQNISQVTEYTSVDSLLEKTHQCNQQVSTNVDFKRPDRAYVEWLQSEEILKLIAKHREFPYLPPVKRNKYNGCRKEHESQRSVYLELHNVIEDDNARSGAQSAQSGHVNGSDSLSSHKHSIRPVSMSQSPKPQSLPNHRPLSQSDEPRPPDQVSSINQKETDQRLGTGAFTNGDPLLARFSQLRTSGTPSNRLPYPTGGDVLKFPTTGAANGGSEISSQLSHTSFPDSQDARPLGPRDMPVGTKAPAIPPKRPVNPIITTSLPRAPSPVYSPARNIAAPADIAPPRTSARSTGSVAYKTQQSSNNSYQLPPQNYTPREYPATTIPTSKSNRPSLDEEMTSISPADLHKYSREGYSILLVDVRSRENFDEGHIGFSSVVCIEPFDIKEGTTFKALLASLPYASDEEIRHLQKISSFDLVVVFNENCSTDSFLKAYPRTVPEQQLRYLYDTLYHWNYENPTLRPPRILIGGVDGWVDTFGPQSLKSSDTVGIPISNRLPKPRQRPPARRESIADGSSREIRRRRLVEFRPLDHAEEEKWKAQAQREQMAPSKFQQVTEDEEEDTVLHNYDEFFRKFPPVEQQSMITPRPPQPRAPAPLPSAPSLPAPAAARPIYSGVSEPLSPQASIGRPQGSQPPLYTSKFVTYNLKLPRTGLVNFGNTCYLNSTMQCLSGTIAMSRFFLDETWRNFLQRDNKKIGGSQGIMPEIYAALIRGLWKDDGTSVRPISLRKFCARLDGRWNNDQQQDAPEFLGWLIDTLHTDLNQNHAVRPRRPLTEKEEANREKMPMPQVSKIEWDSWAMHNYSFISTLFAGQWASRLTCPRCNGTSTTYEPFWMLTLELPRDKRGPLNINQLLDKHFQEEVLDANNTWNCPTCKSAVQAKKQMRITRVPQILAIMFKRQRTEFGEVQKMHAPIAFPLHGLDIGPYMWNTHRSAKNGEGIDHAVTPPFLFEAYAVLRHIGSTVKAGHYTAIVRDTARSDWKEYNDSNVSPYDPYRPKAGDELQNQQAYVVFYERSRAR